MKTKFYSLGMALVALWLFSSAQLFAQTPSITLLQPTVSGIEWTAGGTYVISWTDNFQSTVDVILINDDSVGTPHHEYTLATGVKGSTYYWKTTGYPLGAKYKIKVQSHLSPNFPGYSAQSANYFELADQAGGFITLEQPVGGETWAEKNTYVISWNDNLIAPVKVELLISGNSNPVPLVHSTKGSTFKWKIPTGYANDGQIYKIRVSSTVSGATTPPAISGLFKISASAGTYVEVLQPNGGEKWAKGTTHVISWNDDIPERVNIELSADGNTFHPIASNVLGSTYVWHIPSNYTIGDYKVYVKSTLDPTHLIDNSNNNFSITASGGTFVEVIQPNGGEHWARGTSHLISWNDDIPERVNIELSADGTNFETIASNVLGSTYVWHIPSTHATGDYKVYVKSTLDPTHLIDNSNNNFSITASAGTFVEVIQPNGGESWARGDSYLISWNDDIPERVNIELSADGTNFETIASNVLGSTYVWHIPSTHATGDYKVYVKSTLDPTNLIDNSNNNFSITASTGTFVTVNQPNGGEIWIAGTAHLISWLDDFPEKVNIELWKGGSLNSTIANNVPGSTKVWHIPSAQTPGSDYQVRIYSTLDGTLEDFSNTNFQIVPPAMLTPYPNPANNNVTINMENMGESSNYVVQVYNRFNNKISEYNTNSNSINLSTANWVNGIYFVVVTSDNNRATTKIIVQH